jgi:hypothetical protein
MLVFYSIWRWGGVVGALVTSTALVHAQAPQITTVTPSSNARAAARTESVRVTFSQPLTAASAAALQIFSSQRGGRRTHLTPASGRAAILTFTPTAYAFQPGETVNYTITTAAASSTAALVRPRVGQFTAAVSCTGTGAFQPSSQVDTGRYPDGMALGDIDGDGDLDLLVAHFSAISNTVSICFNDGTGKYSGTQSVVVGNAPKRVVLGDMDGDGDLDIVTANQGSRTVSVRLNDGTGQFGGGSDVAVDYYPTRVALGDLDGDGDLDLLVSTVAGQLNVRLNDGGGAFRAGQSVRAGSNTTDVVLGDVDGDGDLDALAANLSSDTFSVRLNDGTGTFSGTLDVPTAAQPQAIVAGDVDGDGDLDVVVTSGGTSTAHVHLNAGTGTFQPGQRAPVSVGPYNAALGDVDGDGDLDLLTANIYGYVSLTFNQGQGSFTTDGPPNIVTDFVNTADLVLGDVDGDGDLDLVTSNKEGREVGIRLNAGTVAASASPLQLTGPGVLCAGTSGELLATSPSPPQAYRWSTGETTARITIRQPGLYTVTATFAGCQTSSAEYVVGEGDCVAPLAVLPNIITPNGDQLNDVFSLAGLPPGPWALVLFNRWGREVYRTQAYQNDWGSTASPGLYYYLLQHPASGTSQRGWLQVVK